MAEIGAAASHLKIYNYIIKKNISQAIIMEDDAYPSVLLKEWIKQNVKVKNDEILSFYSYPSSSFLDKKTDRSALEERVLIHSSLRHTYSSACYQINNFTCKRIIKLTKNKVIGLPDWPFLINKENIYLSVTLPFMAIIDDKGISNLKLEREKILNKNKLLKIILPENILSILRIPYYLSYLGFFLKFKNKDFYYEHFFQKQLLRFKNFFFRNYIDINKIYYIKKYYVSDLRKFVKKK